MQFIKTHAPAHSSRDRSFSVCRILMCTSRTDAWGCLNMPTLAMGHASAGIVVDEADVAVAVDVVDVVDATQYCS